MRIPLLPVLGLLAAACSSSPPPATPAPSAAAPPAPTVPDAEPSIRVHLRSFGDWTQLRLKGKGGLTIRAGDKRLELEELTIVQTERSSLVSGIEGEQARVEIEAKQGVFTLGSRTYSGRLVLDRGRLVNVVPMENYVLGVLRGELPLPDVPLEAARAQAIAVRSYTFHYLLQGNDLCDVDDTSLYQVYAGLRYAPADATLRDGVNSTRGRYLAFKDAPLKAYYHSTCGGHTTDVPTGLDREPVGCMPGVPCEFCRISKYWRWETTLPGVMLEVLETGPGGRARLVRVHAEDGAGEMHANEFRLQVGASKLRSTLWLEMAAKDGALSIRGAGWGHGVGLCQMGAIGRAQEGQKGEEIVLAYYPGATLVTAY